MDLGNDTVSSQVPCPNLSSSGITTCHSSGIKSIEIISHNPLTVLRLATASHRYNKTGTNKRPKLVLNPSLEKFPVSVASVEVY